MFVPVILFHSDLSEHLLPISGWVGHHYYVPLSVVFVIGELKFVMRVRLLWLLLWELEGAFTPECYIPYGSIAEDSNLLSQTQIHNQPSLLMCLLSVWQSMWENNCTSLWSEQAQCKSASFFWWFFQVAHAICRKFERCTRSVKRSGEGCGRRRLYCLDYCLLRKKGHPRFLQNYMGKMSD